VVLKQKNKQGFTNSVTQFFSEPHNIKHSLMYYQITYRVFLHHKHKNYQKKKTNIHAGNTSN
jgi:hypothetical protein